MVDDQDTMKPSDEQMSDDSQSETTSTSGSDRNSGDLSRSDLGSDGMGGGMGSGSMQPDAEGSSLTRKGGMMLGRVSQGHDRFGKMKNMLQDIIGRADAMELRPTGVTLYAGNKALNLNDPALARALGDEHPSVNGWLDADNVDNGDDEGVRE